MSFEKSLALIPILAVALAITFDVGYFWAVDINFFTFFSLSEHIVFAVQAVPIVVFVIVISLLLAPLVFWWAAVESSEAERRVAIGTRKKKRHWPDAIIWIVLFSLTGVLGYLRLYSLLPAQFFTLVVLAVLERAPIRFMKEAARYRTQGVVGFLAINSILCSLGFGYLLGDYYVKATDFHPHRVHLKDRTEIIGRVVRSGERGILFVVSDANSLRFIRFDDVAFVSKED